MSKRSSSAKELPANWDALWLGMRASYEDGQLDDARTRCDVLRSIIVDCGIPTLTIDQIIKGIEKEIASPKKKKVKRIKKCEGCGKPLQPDEIEFGFCVACLEAEPE